MMSPWCVSSLEGMNSNRFVIKSKLCTILQDNALWSAELLYSNPQALEDIHLDFLRNGADIIITASYQVIIIGAEIAC